jgi:hypothetical protein
MARKDFEDHECAKYPMYAKTTGTGRA